MAQPSAPSVLKAPWWRRSNPQTVTPPPPPQPVTAAPAAVVQPAPPARARPANRAAPRSSAPVRPTSKAGQAVQQFHGMRVGVRPPFTPSESGKPLNCANKTQPGGRVKVVCE